MKRNDRGYFVEGLFVPLGCGSADSKKVPEWSAVSQIITPNTEKYSNISSQGLSSNDLSDISWENRVVKKRSYTIMMQSGI